MESRRILSVIAFMKRYGFEGQRAIGLMTYTHLDFPASPGSLRRDGGYAYLATW